MTAGIVTRVNGPVVEVEGMAASMLDLVHVGPAHLPGEVIGLRGPVTTVQVYEYTGGLAPGDPAVSTGHPLVAELGPGLVGGVFDGMLRRLSGAPDVLAPGAGQGALEVERRWAFVPGVAVGDAVAAGAVLGRAPETASVEFRALVPDGVAGRVEWVREASEVSAWDAVARVAAST